MFDFPRSRLSLRRHGPRLQNLALFSWMTSLIVACAPIDVRTEASPSVDFSRYETYAQLPSSTPRTPETPRDGTAPEAGDAALRREIDSALAATRYRRVDEEMADLLIRVSLSEKAETRIVNAADPDADYYVPREFVKGTIVVEALDASTGAQVWRGTARTETPTRGALIESDPEFARRRAVREMLEEFPE